MTFQAHAAAVLGLLDADNVSPALVVYDSFVPTGAALPYVVVYFSFESPPAETDSQSSDLVGSSSRVDCWAYCHCVGANGLAARAVAARTRVALLDVTPTVTGRTCFPIRHIENQPAVRDETTGALVMDQVDVYRLSSVPG
jgi:hypothetical protein